jgi:flavin reductase (DIM6/NTAB) family NADH-FMN oxidoreductase RutF
VDQPPRERASAAVAAWVVSMTEERRRSGRPMSASAGIESRFRVVMASVCTPVSIATAFDGSRPHGTTISAFASLSMKPPMILVSLDRESDLLALVRQTGKVGLNVLGAGHSALACAFARKGKDKFTGVDWELSDGVPRIVAALGWLACDVTCFVEGGDHIIALAEVRTADSVRGAPLTYHERIFGTHTANVEAQP